jgi:hypothetical protein
MRSLLAALLCLAMAGCWNEAKNAKPVGAAHLLLLRQGGAVTCQDYNNGATVCTTPFPVQSP